MLPEPFIGLPEAPVVLLNLNPGFGPGDLEVHQRDGFRNVLRQNLVHGPLEYPFYFLDPTLAETPGARWWAGKLRWLLEQFEPKELARSIFCVEYFPYHSRRFRGARRLRLDSQQYGFELVRRAVARGAVVVVMRSGTRWIKEVPQLGGYAQAWTLHTPKNVVLSPGNFDAGGFDAVVSAIRKHLGGAAKLRVKGPMPEDNGQHTTDNGQPNLATEIAGVHFDNPVLTASGTFGYGREFADLIDLNQLGGIVVKGISAEPMAGNPSPRIYETDSGMLNAIGLQNVGAGRFLEEKLPFLRTLRTRCIVNVFGYSTEDYVRAIEILNHGDGIDAYELNISCPNTRCGGMVYGSDLKLTEEVVAASKRAARFPLFVKLSPNVTDITAFARAAEAAGADALSLVNTFVGMAIDVESRTPRVSNITAGLSGPAIKPVALRMVYQCVRAVRIPVIGMGGIAGAEDALEYLIAGAQAVQIGTANFYAPDTALRVIEGIREYCRRKRLQLSEVIGSLKVPD